MYVLCYIYFATWLFYPLLCFLELRDYVYMYMYVYSFQLFPISLHKTAHFVYAFPFNRNLGYFTYCFIFAISADPSQYGFEMHGSTYTQIFFSRVNTTVLQDLRLLETVSSMLCPSGSVWGFQFVHIFVNTYYWLSFVTAYWVWCFISLWFGFASPWWLIKLSIFSCVCWPLVYPLFWGKVYSDPFII